MTRDTLSTRLRWLMWRDNITQGEFCKRAGISPAGFSKLINAQSAPQLQTLKKISDAFGVSIAWLSGEGRIEDGYAANVR